MNAPFQFQEAHETDVQEKGIMALIVVVLTPWQVSGRCNPPRLDVSSVGRVVEGSCAVGLVTPTPVTLHSIQMFCVRVCDVRAKTGVSQHESLW